MPGLFEYTSNVYITFQFIPVLIIKFQTTLIMRSRISKIQQENFQLPLQTSQNFYSSSKQTQASYLELSYMGNLCKNMNQQPDAIQYLNQLLKYKYALKQKEKRLLFGLFKKRIQESRKALVELNAIHTKNENKYQSKVVEVEMSLLVDQISTQIESALQSISDLQQIQANRNSSPEQLALTQKIKGDFYYFQAAYSHIPSEQNHNSDRSGKKNDLTLLGQIKDEAINSQLQSALSCYKNSQELLQKQSYLSLTKLEVMLNILNLQQCLSKGDLELQQMYNKTRQYYESAQNQRSNQTRKQSGKEQQISIMLDEMRKKMQAIGRLIELDSQIKSKKTQLNKLKSL